MPDPGDIGRLAAHFMQEIEQDYPDGFELGDVLIVAEVIDPEAGQTTLQHSCSSSRVIVALGLAELASTSLRVGEKTDDA